MPCIFYETLKLIIIVIGQYFLENKVNYSKTTVQLQITELGHLRAITFGI